jgi:hypothetical protein
MLITSGLSDFLVIDTFVWLFAHYGPTELTNALLEYYKMVRKQDSGARIQNSEARRALAHADTPIRRHADTFLLQPLPGNENWSLECNLFAIGTRSAAIDDDKFALQEKRKQSVMPDSFRVVDAFTSLGEEDAHRPFVERPRGRNYGKVRVFGKRYERLASQRMALHDADFERQWSRFAAEQAEQRSAILIGDIDQGQVMEPLCGPIVNRVVLCSSERDHVSERSKRVASKSLNFQWKVNV